MLEAEELFSSYGRTKVLEVILESGELNISEITRRSGLSHTAAAKHLEFLTGAGIVSEKRFNRIRIFRLERSNPYSDLLLRFFADWKIVGATVSPRPYLRATSASAPTPSG